MANELDPHHLVALMNFTLASEKNSTVRPIRSRSPTGLTFGGPTDNYPISFTAFPVLDAIAAISASRAGSQVIAVALQLDTQRQQIRLTIAANKTIEDDLVSYLVALWGKLQALSNAYTQQRLKPQWPHLDCGRSPDMPADVVMSLKVAIFRDIYRSCMGKQIKRMNKWLGGLTSLQKQLIELRGEEKNLQGFELNLYRASVLLEPEGELLSRLYHDPQTELTDAEWEKIYRRSMLVSGQAVLALADRNGCEMLAWQLIGIALPSPNLIINWNSGIIVPLIF